jgi:hypothetical protein
VWEAIDRGYEKIAMVGTGCNVEALRRLQALHDSALELDRVKLLIGLFGTEEFWHRDLVAFLSEREGIDIRDVERFYVVKGEFIVVTKEKEFSIPTKDLDPCVRDTCRVCEDFSSQLADVSAGSSGSPVGWTSVIIRTQVGEELVNVSASAGIIVVIGENVCGVDKESVFTNGKVTKSPEMERRVKLFKEYWDGKYGDIVVQTNVEDQRFGVDEYVVSQLDVNIVERKWGQGAKAIGGEIRVSSLERALDMKKKGYIVQPDPEEPAVQEAFKDGLFKTFERHSRVGFPEERGFVEDVEWLRGLGTKYVTIKTGAYRPVDVAWTMKVASEAKVDYVTFDGAGGGTGMSPVPMMNEMSTPTVYLEAQVLRCARILEHAGKYVPDISMAGGFINETQIFKAIAMSNFGNGPFIKSITMARSPLASAMKSLYFTELAEKNRLPRDFANKYGNRPEKFFIATEELKKEYGDKIGTEIPWSAVGVYTYLSERLGLGLKQLLAGTRKFKLDLIDRSDIATLSKLASEVTGIPMLHEVEQDMLEGILLG